MLLLTLTMAYAMSTMSFECFTKQHFFTLVNVLDKKNECLLATLNQTLRVLETHIYNLVQIVQALTSSNIGRQEKRANMS